jgi:hypothetical protein
VDDPEQVGVVVFVIGLETRATSNPLMSVSVIEFHNDGTLLP